MPRRDLGLLRGSFDIPSSELGMSKLTASAAQAHSLGIAWAAEAAASASAWS